MLYKTGYYAYFDKNDRSRQSNIHVVFVDNFQTENVTYKIRELPVCGSKGIYINSQNFHQCSPFLNFQFVTCKSCRKWISRKLEEMNMTKCDWEL